MSRAWMPLYIGDYLADTGHLSTAEHGCYLLLIMHYWQNGSLPDDDARLAQICRCRLEDWRRRYRSAMVPFFDPGWVHTRVEAELSRSDELSNKRKAAALQKHSKRTANAPTITTTVTKKEDDGDDARAREAFDVATQLAAVAGYPSPLDWPTGWCGAPHRVQAMLAAGWKPDVMLATARAVMAKKRDGPPSSIAYFEKAFASAHAQQNAPLPVVEVAGAKVVTLHNGGGNGRAGSVVAAADRLIERLGGWEVGASYVPGSEGPKPLKLDSAASAVDLQRLSKR